MATEEPEPDAQNDVTMIEDANNDDDVNRTQVIESNDHEDEVEVRADDEDQHPSTSEHKKKRRKPNPHHLLHQHTHRKPTWTYFHLALISSEPSTSQAELDMLTARQYFDAALKRFLGLHGLAVPIDILKFDGETREMWIRCPREDADVVHEALSSWAGGLEVEKESAIDEDDGIVGGSVGGEGGFKFVVKGRDEWLIRLAMSDGGKDGQDLFNP